MATAAGTIAADESPKINLFQEFRAFLDKYGVIGLAIAFIIGAALTALVQAVVADILMPLIKPGLASLGENWQDAKFNAGPFGPFLIGHFVYAVIYFLIVAMFVFILAKFVLREKQVGKL